MTVPRTLWLLLLDFITFFSVVKSKLRRNHLSALNVDFNGISFDLLGSRSLLY